MSSLRAPHVLFALAVCCLSALVPAAAQAVNNAPNCEGGSVAARSGAVRHLTSYCYDPDEQTLTLIAGSGPSHGSLANVHATTLSTPGYIAVKADYTSSTGYTGPDSFQFKANDGTTDSNTATALIDVKDASYNTKPSCYNGGGATEVESGETTDIYVGCTDAEGDPLTYSLVDQPAHGTATISSYQYEGDTYVDIEYKPATGYSGPDSLSYKANDGRVDSDTITVSITVKPAQAPVCQTRPTLNVRTDGAKYVSVYCSSSRGGGPVTYEITDTPDHGTLSSVSSSYGRYTPAAGYSGADSFSYRATNSVGSSAVVAQAINVGPDVNTAPSCGSSTKGIRANTAATIYVGCDDEDGDPVTYRLVEGQGPQHGTVVITTGQFGEGAWAKYTPDADYVGDDSFQVVANDGRSDSAASTMAITVHGADWNTAPSCYEYTRQVETGATSYVDGACYDEQDDPLTLAVTTQPEHGTVTKKNGEDNYQYFEYKSAADYTGPDEFSYKANDGRADSSVVTAHLDVVPVQPPQCQDFYNGTVNVRSGQARSLYLECYGSSAGGALHYSITEQPKHGTLEFRFGSGSGEVTYTSEAGYDGTDSFSYKAKNDAGSSDVVTQSLTISPEYNTVPNCYGGYPGEATPVRVGQSVSVDLYCYDDEGDPLTYSVDGSGATKGTVGEVTQPAGPTLPARVTYTAGSQTGSDAFTFKANDGRADSSTATLAVNVLAADYNSPPTCSSYVPQYRVAANATLVFKTNEAQCSDGENDTLTIRLVDGPRHGTLSAPDADGVSTYTPNPDYTGPDEFSYNANDGHADSEQVAKVSITVTVPSQVQADVPNTPSGDPVRVQNYVDPSSGETFVIVPRSQASEFPDGCMPITLSTEINPGSGTVSAVQLALAPKGDGVSTRVPMSGGDPAAKSTWSGTLNCAVTGALSVEYDLTEGDTTQHVVVPIGGLVLIDPQGVIYDTALYNAAIASGKSASEARVAAAIQGATVVLQRLTNDGWKKVLSGDPGISPNVNPQVTLANGVFQWDVNDGTYRVVVSKTGYETATSRSVTVPPPVLDLHVGLTKTPSADTTQPDTTPSSPPVSNPSATPQVTPAASPAVTTAVTTPKAPKKAACAGLTGKARATCQAKATYKKALGACAKKKGKKKGLCQKKAKATLHKALAKAKGKRH